MALALAAASASVPVLAQAPETDLGVNLAKDPEFRALRARYLAGVLRALDAARDQRAGKFAPRSYAEAQRQLAVAEAALNANRGDPGAAAEVIATAESAARTALRIAELARSIDRGERSPEQLLLDLDAMAARLSTATGIAAAPIATDPAAATALIAAVEALRERAEAAEREGRERDRQIAGLEQEIAELNRRLGGATAERDKLVMTLEAGQRATEQLRAVEAILAGESADVLQIDGNLVLRIRGLAFAKSAGTLAVQPQPLLDKVRQALELYPRARLHIEAHTDETGDAAGNLRVSEERANAVRTYLRQALQIPVSDLESRGVGESQPVASNATAAGRFSNRRIEIVVEPRPEN